MNEEKNQTTKILYGKMKGYFYKDLKAIIDIINKMGCPRKDLVRAAVMKKGEDMVVLLNAMIARNYIYVKKESRNGNKPRQFYHVSKESLILYAIDRFTDVPDIEDVRRRFSTWYRSKEDQPEFHIFKTMKEEEAFSMFIDNTEQNLLKKMLDYLLKELKLSNESSVAIEDKKEVKKNSRIEKTKPVKKDNNRNIKNKNVNDKKSENNSKQINLEVRSNNITNNVSNRKQDDVCVKTPKVIEKPKESVLKNDEQKSVLKKEELIMNIDPKSTTKGIEELNVLNVLKLDRNKLLKLVNDMKIVLEDIVNLLS